MVLRQEHWEALLNQLHETKGRAWLKTDYQSPTKEEIREFGQRQHDYFDATWDLEHATADASVRGDKVKRMLQLAERVKALEDRDRSEDSRLSFDDYGAFLERDQLPEVQRIEQAFADLSPLPQDLEQDATGILNHLHYEQGGWESRVAYRHYELLEKEADEKRSRAYDAARAIRDMPGARLLAPY
jgi:hypothetical protein